MQTVGVFTPAGIPDPDAVQRGLARLRSWGCTVLYRPCETPRGFLAGADRDRCEQLMALVRDPAVDVLLTARGGYGCTRLLEMLDWEALRGRGLPLIGYSDATALHLAAHARGLRLGISGPMLTGDFARPAADDDHRRRLRRVFEALRSTLEERSAWDPGAFGLKALRHGACHAPLVPANLSVLCSLLGTPHLPDLSDHILVLEDINEPAYRIDRFLTQLRQTGVLGNLAGLVFGAFSGCEDARWLPQVFADAAAAVRGPVVSGLPFGHVFPSVSLRVGTAALLIAEPGVPPMLRAPP